MTEKPLVVLCKCCVYHPDDGQHERVITCVECGEQCSCIGCVHDAWIAAQEKLDEEREASLEGGE